MKKSISVLFSILVMLSSCSKDPASGPGSTNTGNTNTDQDNDSGITIDRNEFTAIIDETHETSAKTTLNENQVSWNEGDAISIFDGSGTNFRFVAESSGTSVTFTKVTEGTLTGNTFFAIYPYQDSNSIEGGVISAKTPESYTVDNSAFTSAKSALMIARTTNNELHFKNVSSLLKFEVPEGVDIAKMYFYASGADLSGNVSLSFDEAGQPVINTATPEYKGITIMAEENGTLPAGTYYLPVIPNTYNNIRIKITYGTLDGPSSEAFSLDQLSASRNTIKNIGTIYDGRSWFKWLTFENGTVPSYIATDGNATFSIVDNPVKGAANGSEKSMKVTTETKGSGYFNIDLSKISSNIRANITGIVLHYKPVETVFCPQLKCNSLKKGPVQIGSQTASSATDGFTGSDYKNKIQKAYWNRMTFRAAQFGIENFKDITSITIYPMLYSSGNNYDVDAPAEVLFDNIGFCFD